MPTATPAFTSFVRRSSLALSLSSVIGGFLWPPASLGKPNERALQTAAAVEGRAVAGVGPAGARSAVRFGGHRQDPGPDRARAPPAAPGRAAGIDPVPDLHQGRCR